MSVVAHFRGGSRDGETHKLPALQPWRFPERPLPLRQAFIASPATLPPPSFSVVEYVPCERWVWEGEAHAIYSPREPA